ncbi:uncharacterized protein LOC127414683, partial [Myxocyprinus asiaticus]|uniref:uncharacterized protein LOC127414683 n=1 Tax=Myxocyprinus asiaticus TaxID=70543 RepID=UPI00222397BA
QFLRSPVDWNLLIIAQLPPGSQSSSCSSCRILCLEECRHSTCTPCGHLFCWECITE